MTDYIRKRRTLHLPITLSVALLTLNVTLMVCWIVILARQYYWSALAVGTVAFSLMIVGIAIYLVLTIKEVRLNQRQANFVDSVTHELKSPIASLKLYLETLSMREMEEDKRHHFYGVMEDELDRLDRLINQLLEVGRLDAIGHETEEERILLDDLLKECANSAATHQKVNADDVFTYEMASLRIQSRRLFLEMIFRNLMDNAIKYGGDPPAVHVSLFHNNKNQIVVRIQDHGDGISTEQQGKVFQIFYRGGNELERRTKGTGLGLYIVRTLVYLLKGKITIESGEGQQGTVFEVQLPGRLLK
ncbi:MAG: HAMP domain-containing sensor histidine kinase [Planctomycetaceae bacterium]|nr:HAMP domain-containing sensor histidine kinase [Planctomycetaceae bacterium]